MADLVNYTPVLTFYPRQGINALSPGQALVQRGARAEPVLGLARHRPTSGQIWPRPETPQRDKLGVV